jgi:hypothetical protein
MRRPLSDAETRVIKQVAEKLTPDRRQQLLTDMAHASAIEATEDGARVQFEIPGYQRPPYRGQHSFGVSGELLDEDGTKLSFDLFADENDRLLELELIRWGDGGLMGPKWETLQLY